MTLAFNSHGAAAFVNNVNKPGHGNKKLCRRSALHRQDCSGTIETRDGASHTSQPFAIASTQMSTLLEQEDSDSAIDSTESVFQDLLRDARSGNEQALEKLLQHCLHRIRTLTEAQLDSDFRCRVSSSDIAQTTLLEIHQALDGFRGTTQRQFAAWLESIVAHNVLNEYRYWSRQKRFGARHALSLDSTMQKEAVDGEPTPQAQSRLHEQRHRLEEALSSIPGNYREVIVLRNKEGLDFTEIAARLGRSSDAARMLWARAVERLAEVLRTEEG